MAIYFDTVKRRTTIEIDDGLLSRAQEALGTTGLRDTVHAALGEVVRAALRRRLAERLRTGDGVDLGAEMLEEVRGTWRTDR